MSDNTFLKQITVPNLNSITFARDLREMINNINTNFTSLSSAPYLQGQRGEGVIQQQEPIWGADEKVTAFGQKVFATIFSDINFTFDFNRDFTFTEFKTAWLDNSGEWCGPDSDICPVSEAPGELGHPSFGIDVYYNEVTGIKTIVSLFYLQDNRLDSLSNGYNGSLFNDMSCVIYGSLDSSGTGIWQIDRYNIIPTLYYDGNRFCWKVNGAKTGITAQGVKGDHGDTTYISVFGGQMDSATRDEYISDTTKPIRIMLTHLLSTASPYTHSNDEALVNTFGVCWFDKTNLYNQGGTINSYGSGMLDIELVFGIVQRDNQNNNYIEYYPEVSLMFLINRWKLRQSLNTIGYDVNNTDINSLRGLYVKDMSDPNTHHMIYSPITSSTPSLVVSPTPLAETYKNVEPITGTIPGTELTLKYDNISVVAPDTARLNISGTKGITRNIITQSTDFFQTNALRTEVIENIFDSTNSPNYRVTKTIGTIKNELGSTLSTLAREGNLNHQLSLTHNCNIEVSKYNTYQTTSPNELIETGIKYLKIPYPVIGNTDFVPPTPNNPNNRFLDVINPSQFLDEDGSDGLILNHGVNGVDMNFGTGIQVPPDINVLKLLHCDVPMGYNASTNFNTTYRIYTLLNVLLSWPSIGTTYVSIPVTFRFMSVNIYPNITNQLPPMSAEYISYLIQTINNTQNIDDESVLVQQDLCTLCGLTRSSTAPYTYYSQSFIGTDYTIRIHNGTVGDSVPNQYKSLQVILESGLSYWGFETNYNDGTSHISQHERELPLQLYRPVSPYVRLSENTYMKNGSNWLLTQNKSNIRLPEHNTATVIYSLGSPNSKLTFRYYIPGHYIDDNPIIQNNFFI